TSHASQACDSGHVYWYDSCGGRQEIAQNCSIRGCTGTTCNPIAWVNRDVDFSGATVDATDFAVAGTGDIVAVAWPNTTVLTKRWRGTWADYATVVTTANSVLFLSMVLDAQGEPNIAFAPHNVQFIKWTGSSWVGLGGSDAPSTVITTS